MYFISDIIAFFHKKRTKLHKALILSFWSLLIFGLTNPTYTIQFWTLFFVLRGLIIKTTKEKFNNY